jgi:hypothetical protein
MHKLETLVIPWSIVDYIPEAKIGVRYPLCALEEFFEGGQVAVDITQDSDNHKD